MKKLLFILSAILVSGITYGANNYSQANPFAYDLSSELRNNGNTLALTYTLNADAVTSNTYNTTHGVKINLIDEQQNSYNIRHITDPNSTCVKKGRRTVEIQISEIPAEFKDKPITWEIEVFGNKNRTQPKLVYTNIQTDNSVFYPRAAHGIAVGKNPDKPNFAKLFTAEASTNTLSGKSVPNSLWEYNMQMKYQKYHHKDFLDGGTSHFSATTNTEPHRVKISDDGRIFATCYHETAKSAVVEYIGNGQWKTVVIADVERNSYQDEVLYSKADKYNRRPIAMDVKGSGNDLKIIVAWMKPKGKKINNNGRYDRMHAQIQVIEYEVGSNNYNIDQDNGTVVAEYIDHDTEGNRGGTYDGMLFQSYYYGYNQALHGFIGVAYGDNNSIWLKVDFGFGISDGRRSHILRYDQGSKEAKYTYTFPSTSKYRPDAGYYGGAGLLIKGNQLITGSGSNALLVYTIKNDKTLDVTESNVKSYGCGSPGTSTWLDAITEDHAGNLYCVSEAADNVVIFAMPYDGARKTRTSIQQSFTVTDPVPNIIATDLRVTPHETKPKYIFSFNVNTKPEGAEIRFYTTERAMLDDSKQNAASSEYGNHDNCAYYYRFSELKQGRMSVELDILGHEGGKELTDKKLPSGKLYWNVFLKTRQSNVFAPIYKQPILDENGMRTHYRLYATIDNNPNNEGFGHIYAIDYQQIYTNNDKTKYEGMDKNPCKLMIFTIGDENIDDKIFGNIASDSRYTLLDCLTTNEMVQPRRPTVAPDGMVYLTDYGDYDTDNHSFANGPKSFVHGGIWLFDPKDPFKNGSDTEAKLSRFYDDHETVSDVCFYNDGTSLKLYKTNTYGEFNHHGTVANDPNNYQAEKWMNNGYRIYTMGYNQDGSLKHKMSLEDGPVTSFKVRDSNNKLVGGDANGVFSVRATKDGVWFCQNRKGNFTVSPSNKPDNRENVALMFYNQSGERKFESYTYNGGSLSQSTTAVLQSTPGAGMTISPDEKYLYVVNHEGNILEFEIGGDANTSKTLTLKNTFINSTDYKCISSMNFDYAGNLVVTTDESYPANASEKTQIVVFTMPYNHDNARSIPASEAQREIPERLSQDLDNSTTLAIEGTYDVELYRPLQGATFNTICLPFEVDLTTLPAAHKLYGATVMDFTSVSTPSVGNETVLSLNFTKVDKMLAGKPYVIYVEDHVRGLIEFSQVTRKKTVVPQSVVWNVQNSTITYTGVFNPTEIEEGKTILVDQNRLANVTNEGTLSGFRGYFTIPESLRSLKAMISTRHDTPTGLEDMNITERTYQKFLREGRVYIRMGEYLYTVDGQLVK